MNSFFKLFIVFSLQSFLFASAQAQNNSNTEKQNLSEKQAQYAMKEIGKLYETRNFEKAKERLEAWMAKSPETFPIAGFLLLGNVYDQMKMFQSAIKLYEKGEAAAKNKFPFQINMAQAYRHLKNHQRSIELLNKLKGNASFYPEIFLFLGMSYFETRDRMKTIETWENFLNLKPTGHKSDNVRKALAWLKRKDFKWPEELKEQSEKEAEDLRKFLEDLKETVNKEKLKEIKQNPEVNEEKLEVKDKGKQEGERFDEVER